MSGCLGRLDLRTTEVFHPADQFWALQAIESGLFLACAVGLIALTAWWLSRRVT